MDLSAFLQILRDRRDALTITIGMLEEEQQRHVRAAKSTKRALRQAQATDDAARFVKWTDQQLNGHAPAKPKRGEKREAVLAVLSAHPLKLAELSAKTGITNKHLSVMLSTMQTKKLVARTAKGWIKKAGS